MLLAFLGGLNLRPLQLHITERDAPRLRIHRPYRCGGCCGCPLEMRVYGPDGALLGLAEEDFAPYCSK